MTVKQFLQSVTAEDLVEYHAWMIVQSEDRQRANRAANVEDSLRSVFGRPQ